MACTEWRNEKLLKLMAEHVWWPRYRELMAANPTILETIMSKSKPKPTRRKPRPGGY